MSPGFYPRMVSNAVCFCFVIFIMDGCSKTRPANALEPREKFRAELKGLLDKEDFDQLERIAHQITTGKERFTGGDWKLDRFYEDIADPPAGYFKEQVAWSDRIAKFQRWSAKMPDSIYANVALARAQIGWAWELRGSGFSDKVTSEGESEFEKKLGIAEATLQKGWPKRNQCVVWYRAMQEIGLGLGWASERMFKLLNEATNVEPLYWDVYEGQAIYLMPRWYGMPGDWEKFADDASKRIGGIEGKILYSEICWQISRYYSSAQFYKENNVSWPRIKEGFLAREKQYGLSYRYLNAFCLMAGGAADKLTTRVLINKIGDHWTADFWKEKKYFDVYKKWAFE